MSTESQPPTPGPAARRTRARPRRCNADYRWTLPKAMAFLEALAQCGEVAQAARAVGMSRQAAYALRGRLAGGPLGDGFELARRTGLRARAARVARPRSRWEGPGLDAVAGPRQADATPPQADVAPPQADVTTRQADAGSGKTTPFAPS